MTKTNGSHAMKKIIRIVLVVLVLVLAAAGLWYTRPMTLEQLRPGIDLSACTEIRVSYFQSTEERRTSEADDELTLTPESPAFPDLLAQFQGRTFRRSLLSLLPQGSRTHMVSPGDFRWEVCFRFENAPLPGGGTVSGDILHCRNFFGRLDISADGETWRATTADKSRWLTDVMDAINAAQAD